MSARSPGRSRSSAKTIRVAEPAASLRKLPAPAATAATKETFIAEADRIAADLPHAIRRGPSVAWIGLDWLGDSDIFPARVPRSGPLQRHLRHRLFLAAHAAVTGNKTSAELALPDWRNCARILKSRNAARMARALGMGGGRRPRLDRLRAGGDGEMPARRRLARGCAAGGGIVHRRSHCRGQAIGRGQRQRWRHPQPAAALSRHPIRRRAASGNQMRRALARPASARAGKGGGPGSGRAPDRVGSTACRTARRALPMR